MFAEEFTADRRRLRSVWNPREGTLDVPRCGRSRLGIRRADAYFNTSDFEGFSASNFAERRDLLHCGELLNAFFGTRHAKRG